MAGGARLAVVVAPSCHNRHQTATTVFPPAFAAVSVSIAVGPRLCRCPVKVCFCVWAPRELAMGKTGGPSLVRAAGRLVSTQAVVSRARR